jgi:hypothetical protein
MQATMQECLLQVEAEATRCLRAHFLFILSVKNGFFHHTVHQCHMLFSIIMLSLGVAFKGCFFLVEYKSPISALKLVWA